MANPVINEILRQGRNQPRRRVLAALVTGRVESNFKNLGGGDADSAGWRQERASLYRNPTNLKASVRRFYQEAAKLDRGQRVGELAADVQRPRAEFRGRYAQHVGEAKRLLGSGGATGGTPGTPGRAGAISLGDPGTAVDVAAALSAPASEEPAPTASMPTLPAILTPKGYTPVSAGAAPTPRPKLTDALAKLSSLTDSDSTISGTAGTPGRAGTPGGGGGRAPVRGGSGKRPTGTRGKVIGTPNAGTHTLGNWQSDNAVDIAVPEGTPMVALQDGVVVKVRHHPQDGGRFAGDQITIRGANGNEYFYAHGIARVKPGQKIRRGQKLGRTGSANGVAHLHFGQRNGDPRQHT